MWYTYNMKQEQLKKILHYNKRTGIFKWKITRGSRAKAGNIVGALAKSGYITIGINYKTYQAHRLAWLYVYGYFPKKEIDHKNQNKIDNRISNLREVSSAENKKNLAISKTNTTGVPGVSYYKRIGKWRAYIHIKRKQKHLGFFDNIENAKKAREKAKVKYGFSKNHA